MRLSDVHDCCHCCSGRRASAPPSQPANLSVTFTTTQQRQLRTPLLSHPLSPPAAALLTVLTRLTAATCCSNPHTDGRAARCLLNMPNVTQKNPQKTLHLPACLHGRITFNS